MQTEKLTRTGLLVLGVMAVALFADWLLNVAIVHTGAFTPWNTLLIAAAVTTPVGYVLISQRIDLRRVRETLVATVALKERAVEDAEATRASAEAALESMRKSEELYRLLADNQADVISLWSPEGKRIYTSPSAERAFGFTVDEMMNLPSSANAYPDDLPMLRDLTTSAAVGSPPRTGEYRLMHKDGAAVWVEGTFTRLVNGGLLSTTRVISERKALQDDLQDALAEAKAAVVAKSDFLANMTHELRTPLNAIIGFSGLLRTSPNLAGQDARQVELIHDASQTLLSVVNDVLDFSKLEAGAVEFEHHAFDPEVMARSTVALLAEQAAKKGLDLRVEVDGPGGMLLGDSARLRQVLLNFVSNAVKFTAAGAIEVQVTQMAAGDRRRLRVEVGDSGIGVPESQLAAIFGRFTQGDASVSRQYGGTGLGLAISKRIIESLGGEIGAESTLGIGSTFFFEVELPRANAADEKTAQADEPAGLDDALRLLVVDDNAVNRELICALLQPFDLVIETASDGVEAVAAAAQGGFDLILMDVQMPNMDGLTATARIRATETGPRTPIIAMTANVLPEQVARCLAAGMDDHLGKPINPTRLIETLSRWAAGSEPEETAAA